MRKSKPPKRGTATGLNPESWVDPDVYAREMEEYVRLVRQRAIETLEETTRRNNEFLAKLAKRPIRHFKRSAAEIIRRDRESH